MKLVSMLAVVAVAGGCVSAKTFDMKTMFGVGVGECPDVSGSTAANAVVVDGDRVTYSMAPWRDLVPVYVRGQKNLESMAVQWRIPLAETNALDARMRAVQELFDGFPNLKRYEVKTDKRETYWHGQDLQGVDVGVSLSTRKIGYDFEEKNLVDLRMGDARAILPGFQNGQRNAEVLKRVDEEQKNLRKKRCRKMMREAAYDGAWGYSCAFDIISMAFAPSGVGVGCVGFMDGYFEWTADKKGNIEVSLHRPSHPIEIFPLENTKIKFKYDPDENDMVMVDARCDGKELDDDFWNRAIHLHFMERCDALAAYAAKTNHFEQLRQEMLLTQPHR